MVVARRSVIEARRSVIGARRSVIDFRVETENFFSFFFFSSWTRTRNVEDAAFSFLFWRRKVEGEKISSSFAFLPSRKSSRRKVPDEWSLGKKGEKERLCSFQMTTDCRQMDPCRLQMNLGSLQMNLDRLQMNLGGLQMFDDR